LVVLGVALFDHECRDVLVQLAHRKIG
jgi:hypothetical protein